MEGKYNVVFILFFSTAVLSLTSIGIYLKLGRNILFFNDPGKLYLVFPVFFYVLITSVLGEETGWWGFPLPELQQKYGPLNLSVILGLIWGFWR